jgi:hypothetical protein
MGTDSTMYAQVRRGGFWHLVGNEEENLCFFSEGNTDRYPIKPTEVYDLSAYTSFTIMAGIRTHQPATCTRALA